MQNILINKDFSRAVQRLRAVLPVLSFTLLVATYLISAIIMGIFHAQNAANIGFMIAAFLVPLAIQAGRGTLVFFFQLNPAQIQSRLSFGIVAATALLILSLIEAILVLLPYGYTWIVSVSTLMVIGWVIEIMILREMILATQMELFANRDHWKEVREFYVAKAELNRFISEIEAGKTPQAMLLGDTNEAEFEKKEPPTALENPALHLLDELNEHLRGKENRPFPPMEKGE
ncbi:MAG: hypothetical protein AAFP77_18320 [Bacteroidota bacterium]